MLWCVWISRLAMRLPADIVNLSWGLTLHRKATSPITLTLSVHHDVQLRLTFVRGRGKISQKSNQSIQLPACLPFTWLRLPMMTNQITICFGIQQSSPHRELFIVMIMVVASLVCREQQQQHTTSSVRTKLEHNTKHTKRKMRESLTGEKWNFRCMF